jgi:uncharacterized protein (TIGR00252 family)
VTNFSHGRAAEAAAAEYLKRLGYEILDQNWRTRRCEIDIVARHKNTVYFVEVKYRQQSSQGSGLDYITPSKLRQMSFAAKMWLAQHNHTGEIALSAIEVSGPEYEVTDFIEIID